MPHVISGIGWIAHGVALILAAALCVLLVPLVVLSIVALSTQQLLAPQVWKDVLASRGVYERLPTIAAVQMTHQLSLSRAQREAAGEPPDPGGAPPAFRDLTAAQFEAILREVLPPQWLRSQTERVLDVVLGDPPPSGPIVISLVELKTHLASGAAARAYITLTKAQRPCAAEEILAWAKKLDLPGCRPPDEVLDLATPAITDALAGVMRGLPDQADLRQALAGGEDEEARGESPAPDQGSGGFDMVRTKEVLRTALALPLLPALLLVALAVRSRRALLGWLGTPLVFGGLVTLALGLDAVPLADRGIALMTGKTPAAFSAEIVAVGLDVVRGIVERLAASLAITGVVVTAAGIAMLAIAPLGSRRPPAAPAASAPAATPIQA